MTFDVHAVRKQFPILGRTVHGKPLVYFDNAASAEKPDVVIDAMANQMRSPMCSRRMAQLMRATTAGIEAMITPAETALVVVDRPRRRVTSAARAATRLPSALKRQSLTPVATTLRVPPLG